MIIHSYKFDSFFPLLKCSCNFLFSFVTKKSKQNSRVNTHRCFHSQKHSICQCIIARTRWIGGCFSAGHYNNTRDINTSLGWNCDSRLYCFLNLIAMLCPFLITNPSVYRNRTKQFWIPKIQAMNQWIFFVSERTYRAVWFNVFVISLRNVVVSLYDNVAWRHSTAMSGWHHGGVSLQNSVAA